ncbi:MmcQ/YjbR family DNA-binding protein [uncultured Pseudokineococcus sp.]|uniref:MmcQ/YjbR family DNA-binding protein n=1 Tax=uncultured Pseudokineococcus sp. TaxID=1642928 RepID=UPI0026145778|nr:MmcQ/YjbR family DNA-binding protein [uncultured Pseudokineococcus sp.]
MATWDDVRRLVAALPGTEVHPSYGGRPSWRVGGRAFVWDRPLTAVDREHLGPGAPPEDEPLLGVRVADEGVKQALLAEEPRALLTTPHLDGSPVVLVRLARVGDDLLAELVEDAWRARAPRRLLAERDGRDRGPSGA